MKLINIIFGIVLTISAHLSWGQTEAHWKFDTIQAPSLEGNLLEDPTERLIEIYLPPAYYKSGNRYPVVYYLGGYNGSGRKPNYKVNPLKQLIDEKIEAHLFNEMIIVFVSGSNRLRGSFYVNSPVTGNWADFITQDVVQYVDNNYRTLDDKESRSITGSSMGGYGALNLSMQYPETFCAGYGISPGLYDEDGFKNSQIIQTKGNIDNTLKLVDKFRSVPAQAAQKEFLNFLDTCSNRTLFFTMAYGAAHAPDPTTPPYFKFPVKIMDTDTIADQTIWELWQNGFGGIDKEIDQYRSNLEQLKVYGIACGYNEGYKWIYEGCLFYDNRLTDNRINHLLYLHEGTHTSHTNEVLVNNVLPLLANVMKQEISYSANRR